MEWRKEEVREFPMIATQTTNILLKTETTLTTIIINKNNNKGIIILIIIYNIHEKFVNERLGSKMVERPF